MTGNVLDQIPQVAVQVLKHRHRAVVLRFRFPNKFDATLRHIIIVAPEIICAEEQKHSAPTLVADKSFLIIG